MALFQTSAPEGFGQQAYHNVTTLHPMGMVAVTVLGLVMVFSSRRRAMLPFLLMACFVSPAQRLVIATLDFNLMRVMVIFGMTRILLRGETRGVRWTGLDSVMILWVMSSAMIYSLRVGHFGALVNRLGWAYDALGMYFLFRCLIRDHIDLQRLSSQIAWVSVPVFLAFFVERATGRNPFAFLGGVPEVTAIREGRFRCQGPFPHPILAGVFWASLLPIVFASWLNCGLGRFRDGLGLVCMLGIVVLSASSTPLLAVMVGVGGWVLWKLRDITRAMRWGVLATLVALHVTMNKPVWHLIARVNVVGGSTGYHRYLLIQAAVDHFGEWWLMGVNSTAHWGRMMHDLTNQYVREAVNGGLLGLILFVTAIGLAFRAAGIARKRARGEPRAARMCWGVGVVIFVHTIIFLAISISHSQQNLFAFFLFPAAAGSLHSLYLGRRRRRIPQRRSVILPA